MSLLKKSGPILDLEIRHSGEVANVASNDAKAVHEGNRCDTKVLRANPDALPLQPLKNSVRVCAKDEDIPFLEVENGLHEGGVAVS